MQKISFAVSVAAPIDVSTSEENWDGKDITSWMGISLVSMTANNTSAFNCRFVDGTTRWSQHAYGRAVDVNPLVNPYVQTNGRIDPPAGAQFADRAPRPGLIDGDDAAVRAFAAVGWEWGGNWSGSKDYQHFSRSGN